jgi:hypothetical protein
MTFAFDPIAPWDGDRPEKLLIQFSDSATDIAPRSDGAMRAEPCTKPFAQENRGRRKCRVLAAPAASRAKGKGTRA